MKDTATDAQKAFDIFADTLANNPEAVAAINGQSKRRKRRFDLQRMQDAEPEYQQQLGHAILRAYRRNTKAAGAIDWGKLKQWCMDHWKLILGIKIVLTILFLFCL